LSPLEERCPSRAGREKNSAARSGRSLPRSCVKLSSIRNPTTGRKRRTKTTGSNATKINNGVNVDALLGAREALRADARGRPVQVARKLRMGDRNAQPLCDRQLLRPRRRAVSRQEFPRGSRSSEGLRVRGQRADPGGDRSFRARELPHGRCCRRRQRRGIQLHSVKATLDGDMDIQGILGMDDDIRNGFDGIRVHFDIRADASPDDIKSLVAQSQKRSAVFDIVTNPTNVFVTIN